MFTELKLLDLKKCQSVRDLVKSMTFCSFGARMLGEVSEKLSQWIGEKQPIIAIYDGHLDSPLGKILQEMVQFKWLLNLVDSHTYSQTINDELKSPHKAVIIGAYTEKYEKAIYQTPQESIFINQFGQVKPNQVRDGYYPNVIFADPNFVLPVIYAVLKENLQGEKTTISQLIETLNNYDGVAKEVSGGAKVLLNMVKDPDCTVFLTLSGAMTVAKMGLIICDLIDEKMINGICSTGALMAHGLVESVGLKHFKYNPADNDSYLAQQKLNRITDTLEPEINLDHIANVINKVLTEYEESSHLSPSLFHRLIGQYLADEYPDQRGILKSAYLENVPVFVPAFNDSEIANDIYVHNILRTQNNREKIIFNLELDTKVLVEMVTNSQKIGIFTIGGGVPRNFIQNVSPLIEIINDRVGANLPEHKFAYGCRICPDPMYYGHLSGCTYSEGVSWRKMDDQGQFSEIHTDATLILPFLVKYVMEN
jgi:deoxyhypusine synthase